MWVINGFSRVLKKYTPSGARLYQGLQRIMSLLEGKPLVPLASEILILRRFSLLHQSATHVYGWDTV